MLACLTCLRACVGLPSRRVNGRAECGRVTAGGPGGRAAAWLVYVRTCVGMVGRLL